MRASIPSSLLGLTILGSSSPALANPYREAIDDVLKVETVIDHPSFLRRVSIDLRGRSATASEVESFLDSPSPEKRRLVVEAWVRLEGAAQQWGFAWTPELLQSGTGGTANRPFFGRWLADSWRRDQPWNEAVGEMLNASGNTLTPGPGSFLLSHGNPAEVAGNVARLFLGSSLKCAQCHKHPYQNLTPNDFHGIHAFFARTRGFGRLTDRKRGQAKLSDGTVVKPAFTKKLAPPGLSEGELVPKISKKKDDGKVRRALFAKLISHPTNRRLARATVNRIFARYLGWGLVRNLDDLYAPADQAEHPEQRALLERLATLYETSGFRSRALVEGVLTSQAYQSSPGAKNGFAPRPLRPDQLVGAVASTTGYFEFGATEAKKQRAKKRQHKMLRELEKTGDQLTIDRSLTMMNDPMVLSALSARKGQTLAALIAAHRTDEARIRAMFLTVLNREPRAGELIKFHSFVNGAKKNAKTKAYEDVYWVLHNSAEFNHNH